MLDLDNGDYNGYILGMTKKQYRPKNFVAVLYLGYGERGRVRKENWKKWAEKLGFKWVSPMVCEIIDQVAPKWKKGTNLK